MIADKEYIHIVIMLGSNNGDCFGNLNKATTALREYVNIEAVTPDICTPDISGKGADYLNRLVYGKTTLSLQSLKSLFKQIENSMGRNRDCPTYVVIDIDVVIFGDKIVKPSDYNTPHFRHLAEKLELPLLKIEKK